MGHSDREVREECVPQEKTEFRLIKTPVRCRGCGLPLNKHASATYVRGSNRTPVSGRTITRLETSIEAEEL
jgi:hypothetical protein